MFVSIFKHAFQLLPIFKGAWIPRNACVSTTVFLEVFWDLRASLTASLSNPISISSKTSISSHLHSDLMAGELGIEVGNLFSLWQDLDPRWPLYYYHNWLFNFSHCFSRALWTIHSPSQPPQNMWEWCLVLSSRKEGRRAQLSSDTGIIFQISVLIGVIP